MMLGQGENVYRGVKVDDGCFVEECVGCDDRKKLLYCVDSESDKGCEDIASLLPNDPFDTAFDIEATVAAVSNWVKDCRLTPYDGYEIDDVYEDVNTDGNTFIAEWNFVWTSSVNYDHEEGEDVLVDTNSAMRAYAELCEEQDMLLGDDMEELMFFGCEKYLREPEKDYHYAPGGALADGGAPADALYYALGYLGVRDLLSVEMVCRSLRDTVRNDPLLWRNIHIDYSLNERITDDILMRLTDRANGKLSCLSLVKCRFISNDGMNYVLGRNPGLTKLSVPGCFRISVEDILHKLKAFNSSAVPGIKQLRIGELIGMTNDYFDEFKRMLGMNEDKKNKSPRKYKPRYYRARQLYLPLDDERAIDIEICPVCHEARQVYDCPAEGCQVNDNPKRTCRACIFCVFRCINCGCCLHERAYEETFSFDLLCLDCFTKLFNCEDGVEITPKDTFFHQASYRFFLYT